VPERTRLATEWKGATWMEASGTWHVYLNDLQTGQDFVHETKVLVFAVGGYTNPKYPVLPGLEKFEGPVVHTARWDRDYDLRGRNVAVVGNGCLSHIPQHCLTIAKQPFRFRISSNSSRDR